MARIIVKGGRVCIHNGRYVTDEDGAPCVCGESVSCWLQLLPCGCDDISQAIYLSAGFTASSPASHDVVVTTERCYLIVARFKGFVPASLILNQQIHGQVVGTVESCTDSPCTNEPCPRPCAADERHFDDNFCGDDAYEWCAGEVQVVVKARGSGSQYRTLNDGQIVTTEEHEISGNWSFKLSFANGGTEVVSMQASGHDFHKTVRDGEVINLIDRGGTMPDGDTDWFNYAYGISMVGGFASLRAEISGGVGLSALAFPGCAQNRIDPGFCLGSCSFHSWENASQRGSFSSRYDIKKYFNRYGRYSLQATLQLSDPNDTSRRSGYQTLSQTTLFTPADSGVVMVSDCPDTVRVFGCDNTASAIIERQDIRDDKPYLSVLVPVENGELEERLMSVASAVFEEGDPVPVHNHYDECEQGQYAVYARCTDDTITITVDETDMPDDALTAIANDDQYTKTPAFSNDPPTDVVWSTDPCVQTDNLWRRCDAPDQYLRTNLNPDVQYALFISATPWLPDPSAPRRECRDLFADTFERVTDDGRDAPLRVAYQTSTDCADRLHLSHQCRFSGDEADPPTRPGEINAPPGYNPQQAQLDAFGCRGCGDPGVF